MALAISNSPSSRRHRLPPTHVGRPREGFAASRCHDVVAPLIARDLAGIARRAGNPASGDARVAKGVRGSLFVHVAAGDPRGAGEDGDQPAPTAASR